MDSVVSTSPLAADRKFDFPFFFQLHTCMPKGWHHTIATVWQRACLRCRGWFINKNQGNVLKAKCIPTPEITRAHPAIFYQGNDATCRRDTLTVKLNTVLFMYFILSNRHVTPGETSEFWRLFPLPESGYTAPSFVLTLALSRFSKNSSWETPADNFSLQLLKNNF